MSAAGAGAVPMAPLPVGRLVGWRIDRADFAPTWDSGEGAYRFGGRWNSAGRRAVYASADPATAVLEVAVHKGFSTLDTVAHVLTAFEIVDAAAVRIVHPADVPNPNWLVPGIPGAGQQAFGDRLLDEAGAFLIPSAVSRRSWNLVFDPDRAGALVRLLGQEPFALDTRLHPPVRPAE